MYSEMGDGKKGECVVGIFSAFYSCFEDEVLIYGSASHVAFTF